MFTEKEAEYAFMNPLLFSFLPKIFSLFNKLIDFEFPSIINDYIINVNNKEWIDNYMTTIKSIPMMHSVICTSSQIKIALKILSSLSQSDTNNAINTIQPFVSFIYKTTNEFNSIKQIENELYSIFTEYYIPPIERII